MPPFCFQRYRSEQRRVAPIAEEINAQLAARDAAVVSQAWPPELRADADRISVIIQRELGWASSAYFPDDPLRWLLFAHQDGFDDFACLCLIEHDFRIKITRNDMRAFFDQSLLDLILLVRSRSTKSDRTTIFKSQADWKPAD